MRAVALLVVLSAGVAFSDTYPSAVPDPLPVPVTVQAADGGVQVLDVQGRGGGPLQAEVTGPGAGAVNVSGSTVSLSAQSLTALSAPVCTLADPQMIAALSTTPTLTPTTPYAARTELRVVNLSTNREVWCRKDPGDGGVPTSTTAYVLLPNGGDLTLPVRSTDVVRCRADTATARVNIMESACAQ